MRNPARSLMAAVAVLALAAISCEHQAAHTGMISIEHKGSTHQVPSIISFDGDEWTFSHVTPNTLSDGMTCTYESSTYSNESLTLSVGGVNSMSKWSIRKYRCDDRHSDERTLLKTLRRSNAGFGHLVDCENGTLDGPTKRFYANGSVKFIGHMADYAMDGDCRGFYPNGNVWWIGEYRMRTPLIDKAVFYNENGSVNTEIDTIDERLKEHTRWHQFQTSDSCDSIQEFIQRVESGL